LLSFFPNKKYITDTAKYLNKIKVSKSAKQHFFTEKKFICGPLRLIFPEPKIITTWPPTFTVY